MFFTRQRIVKYYFVIYVPLAFLIFFGLRAYSSKNFSQDKLDQLMTTPSRFRDKTDDFCRYAIKGDPKDIGNNYIKIDFNCKDGTSVISTLALKALPDLSFQAVLSEYARIIGFDVDILNQPTWKCLLNANDVTNPNNTNVGPGSHVSCTQSIKHD